MRLLAPAKINLYLRVGPSMADGFHPLLTWMCTVGLFDTMDVSTQPAPSPQVLLHCSDPQLPTDGRNLVAKAASLFLDAFAIDASVYVVLQKKIPAGGGLGGGSSDAAAMLLGLRRAFDSEGSDEALAPLAAKLGSDVPFFLHGPSAVCKGRGEMVRAIAPPAPPWAMLILPPFGVATPEVYRRFDRMDLGREENVSVEPDWQTWSALPAAALMEKLVNDLEAPAFAVAPQLEVLRRDCERKLGRVVRMSGSGSTLFTLYDGREEAERDLEKIRSAELGSVIVETAP